MNIVGVFMWVAVGGTALHYWNGYLAEHDYIHVASERTVIQIEIESNYKMKY